MISIVGVAIINFFNFMDGSDGLQPCSSVLLLAFFLLGQPYIVGVVGSLLGFLDLIGLLQVFLWVMLEVLF